MEKQTEQPFRSGFVSIVGRPNVGKSTLLNRILGQKIAITSPKPQTTRNRILGIHTFAGGQILFLDTPGIHRARGRLNKYMVDQALSACSEVDLILFLVEADRPIGEAEDFILEVLRQGRTPVLLVINKIDRVGKPALLPLIDAYARKFPFQAIVPVSALAGEGIDELVAAVAERLPTSPPLYPEDMITDLPERFIAAEMVRSRCYGRRTKKFPTGWR